VQIDLIRIIFKLIYSHLSMKSRRYFQSNVLLQGQRYSHSLDLVLELSDPNTSFLLLGGETFLQILIVILNSKFDIQIHGSVISIYIYKSTPMTQRLPGPRGTPNSKTQMGHERENFV